MADHVYVQLERDEHGYPPFSVEEIEATALGPGRYLVEGIPVFVYGLARGDVVEVVGVEGDSRLWVAGVLEVGGHWTTRVLPWDRDALVSTASRFTRLGLLAWPAHGLVAVDVPPTVAVEPVLALLESGKANGSWDFDFGVGPPGTTD